MARMKAAYANRLQRRMSARQMGIMSPKPSDMSIGTARNIFSGNDRAQSALNLMEGMGTRMKGGKYNAKPDFKKIFKGAK